MIKVAELKLDLYDTKYYAQINNYKVKLNDSLIIETNIGTFLAKIIAIKKYNKSKVNNNLCKIIRIANDKDKKIHKKNNIISQQAFIKCRELIKKYNLNMNLINSIYTFDRKQLIFKFTSDERVDFRNLAKELANIYKTRIELRQIGVRDKAKEIGGCGQCGQELCCKRFLNDFNSVSINMAKNQNIALNPNKINGICGRLLCCLKYEDDCYKKYRKNMPSLGKTVKTEEGTGKVVNVDILKRKYWVEIEDNRVIECILDESIK